MENTKFMSQAELKTLLTYDPETGHLHWRANHLRKLIGRRAGYRKRNRTGPSWVVKYRQETYQAHNLIWVLMTGHPPKDEIDHINRDHIDNRWANLRECTRSQNQANTRLYRSNRVQARGVHMTSLGRWRAMISERGKNKHIGYFDTLAEAQSAWQNEAVKVHGELTPTQ